MNFINFLLYASVLSLIIIETYAIDISRVKNNMLRIYVFSSPKPLRKGIIKQLKHFFINSSEKANIYIFDANASYYSLSEEDRLIIETIISLTY